MATKTVLTNVTAAQLAAAQGGVDSDRRLQWIECPAHYDVAALTAADLANDPAVCVLEGQPVDVVLDSANGPKALYLGSLEIEEVLAALPAGWTVHEADWSNAVQIDDLTWSVPLTRVEKHHDEMNRLLGNGDGSR
jgi:hypothetical protein